MATVTSTLIVKMLDQVSGPARTAAQSILGIGDAAKRASGGAAVPLAERMGASLDRTNAALDRTRGRLVDAVGGFYLLKNTVGSAVGSAISFESAMADVAKVSDFDDEGLKKYALDLRGLATSEIPMAVTELAALSEAAAQSGIADEELLSFTRMTAKTAVAWGISGAAAGEALAKIKTQLGLTTDETRLYGDAINHVSDNTAASAPEMIDYTRRVAAQGEFYGFAATETLAFGAAMVATGADANVAATSFRNMGRALTKGASATKRQRGAFKTLGLDAMKVSKAMQEDAMGTTIAVIERLNQLPDYMQASVMSDLFGDEARALSPLIGRLDILKDTLGLVNDEKEYAGSVDREFQRRSQTTEYVLQRLKNQIVDVGLSIGDALLPTIQSLANALGPIVQKISDFANRFPGLTRAVTIAAAGFIALRVALIGLQFGALLARAGLLSALLPVVRLATWAKTAATGSIALQSSLAAMSGLKLGGIAKAAIGFKGIAQAVPIIGGVLTGVSAPVVAAIGAIAAAGFTIHKYWDHISSFFSGFASVLAEELSPAIEAAKPYFEWLKPIGEIIAAGWERAKAVLSSVGEWLGSFFSREVLDEDGKKQWAQAGADAARAMIDAIKSLFSELVSWAKGIGSQIGSAIGGAATGAINRVRGWFGGGDEGVEARAKGGRVRSGGTYLVGEEGPELRTDLGNGRIIPSGETMRLLRSFQGGLPSSSSRPSGSAPVVNAHFVINDATDPKKVAREVVRELNDAVGGSLRGVYADVGVD